MATFWEVMYDIVEGGDKDYMFDFEHLQLTTMLLMLAVLLSMFHGKWVFVVEPTSYYSALAVHMFRRWKLDAPKVSIRYPGFIDIMAADAIFHHGKQLGVMFSCVAVCMLCVPVIPITMAHVMKHCYVIVAQSPQVHRATILAFCSTIYLVLFGPPGTVRHA